MKYHGVNYSILKIYEHVKKDWMYAKMFSQLRLLAVVIQVILLFFIMVFLYLLNDFCFEPIYIFYLGNKAILFNRSILEKV